MPGKSLIKYFAFVLIPTAILAGNILTFVEVQKDELRGVYIDIRSFPTPKYVMCHPKNTLLDVLIDNSSESTLILRKDVCTVDSKNGILTSFVGIVV